MERHPLKEKRRANKPLLERKRRARINDSLADLKLLVLTSMNKDVSKYTKMEKVDILDMTVRYLKGQQRSGDYSSIYRAAYTDVYQNILSMEGIDHKLKRHIISNLANHQRDIVTDKPVSSPPPSPTLSSEPPSPSASPLKPSMIHQPRYLYPGMSLPPVATPERVRILPKDFVHYNRHNVTATTTKAPLNTIHPTYPITPMGPARLLPPPTSFRNIPDEIQLPKTTEKLPKTSSLITKQVWRPW